MRILDDWLLTTARAAIHLPTATAVLADVHLGYAEARHRGGDAVPRQNVAAVLAPLHAILAKNHIQRLIVAGDLFEAGPVPSLATELLEWCAASRIELTAVVPGNHDRGLAGLENVLPICVEGYLLGRWRVVHGDGPLPDGAVIQGHEHPIARWNDGIGGPCFLFSTDRLVLPAFSPDAAGVNVLYADRWRSYRCGVIAGERVLDFGVLGELRERMRR